MTTQEKSQHEQFKIAKHIAITIEPGLMRRARYQDAVTNYCGMKDNNGRCWVIGDGLNDVQNPDAWISGKPAREVFEGFTMMRK